MESAFQLNGSRLNIKMVKIILVSSHRTYWLKVFWFPVSHSIQEREGRPLVESVYQKNSFLFLNQNMCCGYSNETVL